MILLIIRYIYNSKSDKVTRFDDLKQTKKEGIIIYFKIEGLNIISQKYMNHIFFYLKALLV
jgi:hypothetical protein